ncbi:NAD-dependent epimerase/dehydratase family protein [Lichenihabitans psoromatis]|uniref:NAD-dependent epimerase/dehydratase family protein n=1 Tax=Lichenihabitans psoromatis TaxID=2528642 RepID=UPI001036E4D5|nr:NAD(P)-dependent oxidoreductase [Lichenihabitans psoromatis]
MAKNIVFTGGSGKAGRHVVQYLVEHGYNVLNLDTKPLDNPKVRTLITDITDSGQVFNALTSTLELHEFAPSLRAPKIDAVVHFAAIPRIMIVPDNEVFRINTMGTYAIVEAAEKLGIRKTIIASSETTYGLVFANEPRDPAYFPLDEDYPVNPMDSYALSKICNERTAHAFQQRTGSDIYAIRIGNVIEPHEYANFPAFFADPAFRKRIAWSYIDARDLGEIIRLSIETDGLGFQIFNAAQNDCSSDLPTAELLKRYYPNVPVKRPLGEYESLMSNKKTREMLGFEEQHNWRKYVSASALQGRQP